MEFNNTKMQPDQQRLKKIKMLLLDVDGVMTDCRVFLGSDGEWKRFFCIRDGAGIKRLIASGYSVGVITGSQAADIRARVKHLGIQYFYEGAQDKEPAFNEILAKTQLSPDEICYVGDDYFDLPILMRVGFAATVPEALPEVKEKVHWITQSRGGLGAVREICDYIYRGGAMAQENK